MNPSPLFKRAGCLMIALLATSLAMADAGAAQAANQQAKVYGLHTIMLRPGVTGEQFERFFIERV